jgi:hypothetical protein
MDAIFFLAGVIRTFISTPVASGTKAAAFEVYLV